MVVRTRVPAIPAPTESNLVSVTRAIKSLLDVREGLTGDPLDRYVTRRELSEGAVTVVVGGGTGPGGIVVNPGTGGDDGEDDPTPPPRPENLRVVAGLGTIQLQWDQWTYGNHAYTEIWRSSDNVIGNAVLIGTSRSRFYADAIGATGVGYYYWVRFVSTYPVTGPYNATEGTFGQTGMVGGVDLSELLIEARHLADGSITASKYMEGSIGPTAIADQAITASKLLITGRGAALNADPMFVDATAWAINAGAPTFATGVAGITGGGSTAARSQVGQTLRLMTSELIELDQTKNYRLEAFFRLLAGTTCSSNILVAWYDENGSHLPSNVAQPAGAGSPAGWASNGTWSYPVAFFTPTGSFARTQSSMGPKETCKLPSNARFFRLGVVLNNGATAGSQAEVTGLRVSEKADYDLLVDGAILANHLAANSIAVGTAAIQNGAIVNAMIGTAAIDTANIAEAAIVSAHIGAAQITDAHIANLNATKITAGTLSADRIGANSITAGKINANGLVIRDAAGNPILGDSVSLSAAYIGAQFGGANLLPNSSFELDTNSDGVPDYFTGVSFGTGITIGNALISVDGYVEHSSRSYRMQVSAISGASTNVHQRFSDYVSVKPGRPYVASIFCRSSSSSYQLRLSVRWYDSGGAVISTDNDEFTASNMMRRFIGQPKTAPTNAATARVMFGIKRPSAADTTLGTHWYDAVQLEEGEIATAYAPSRLDQVSLDNPINAGNAAIYISSAAIGWAQIGDLNINTTGAVRSGQTAYHTGVGFWIGHDAGTPKLSIGDPAGAHMRWTGDDLLIATDSSNFTQLGPNTQIREIAFDLALGTDTTADAWIQLRPDGTIWTRRGAASYVFAGNWYLPTTTGIGSSYWARFTKLTSSGATPTGLTFGTLYAMTSNLTVTMSVTRTGTVAEASAQILVDIFSDSGGTNKVGGGQLTISLTCEQ